jgi:hypothetical protein
VFRVIIEPKIIEALCQFVPEREARLGVLNRLRDRLENDPRSYRRFRDPNDLDFLFD